MKRFFYALMIIGVLFPKIVKADEWLVPYVGVYYSENKEYKLIVIPTFVPPKYYRYSYKSNKHPKSKRLLRKKEELEQQITPCIAELYRISETGSILIWNKPLLNDICPVHAIVTNDGSSVATFDNWYSMGYGENVFVVYDENGEAKKSYELKEISPFPIDYYLKSVVSIWWNKSGILDTYDSLLLWRNKDTLPSYIANDCRFIDNERIEIVFETRENIQKKRVYNVKSLEFEK